MFDRVYLAPVTRPEHDRAHATIRADLRAPGRARRRPGGDRRVHRRDDRPLRSVVRCHPVDGAHQGQLRRSRQGGRRFRRRRLGAYAAAQVRRSLLGALPVPRRAHALVLGQRGRQALLLLRLWRQRRPDHVRTRDGRARLRGLDRMAGRAVSRADRVRGELARPGRSPQAARAARRSARAGSVLLRAHAVGVTGRRYGARLPQGSRIERGDLPRVSARSGARRNDARAQGTREGLRSARSSARRG